MPAICLIRVITAGNLPDSPLIRAIPQRSLSTQPPAPPAHREAAAKRSRIRNRPPSARNLLGPFAPTAVLSVCAKGAPSPLPTTRACSHPNNSQQRARACLSEPRRVSSRPFDVRVRALLRAAVAWCVVPFVTSLPLLRAPPAANAESPSCHVVGCVSVSRRGEEGRVEV